ncbi:MAG TPA: GIDE domain-containing protein [Geopsychrobacteraceae bacterium]|nr:GIDE domain-containing protein [Geopsychrobacteraceae bacterium]
MKQDAFLIVDQQSAPPDNLQELLSGLAKEHGLDAYSCRQRLIGQGLSLLHKGERGSLQLISPLLSTTNIRHWLIEPTKPLFAPSIIRSLKQNPEGITFTCQKKQVIFNKGATVLAVLADLSGQLAERSVKQILASHAYQGIDNVSHITAEKTYKTIIQGKPVLDLYLLNPESRIIDAVRVFPGKFDHKGLGERATASSRQNLHQLLELCRENAGEFHLETSFGLANLPGCNLRKPVGDDPDTLRKNLISLARYGWLMADLRGQGEINIEKQESDDLSGAVTAAILTRNPALAGNPDLVEALPAIKEVANEIRQSTAAKTEADKIIKPQTRTLPAPPPPQTGQQWRTPRFWFGSIGGVVAIVVIFLFEQSSLLPSLAYYGFRLGIVPALFATLMFWGGFHFLHLKRQVENTPTSKIRSVAMGMVEVKGKAIRQYALISPMTHMACAWYRLTKYRRDRNRNWVVSRVTSSGNVPFLLEDETGRVCIDPTGATVRAKSKQEGSPGQSSLLLGSGMSDSDSNEKWVEEIIYEGTIIYVLGFASVKREEGKTLREKKVEALRELKRDPEALRQFDSDGDGKISESEWEGARSAMEERMLQQSLSDRDRRRKQEEQIVIGKPAGGGPFIVAETHSETQLTSRFARYTIPLFIGAAVCTGWAISLLVKWLA